MKYLSAFLVILSAASFAAEVETAPKINGDVKVIFEKTFLTTQSEPFLNMMAMEAAAETQKRINTDELIAQFKESFQEEANFAKYSEPYEALFTKEELTELRKIHENPTWEKYAQQGMQLFQSNVAMIKESFKELALSASTEAEEMVADADLIQLTLSNFNDTVTSSKLPLVVDVNASWCNPCQMMNPIIDELSEEFQDKVQFAKIDYDSQGELAQKFDVTSLPTILFFKPGQKTPVMKNVGFISKKDLKAKINNFLKK